LLRSTCSCRVSVASLSQFGGNTDRGYDCSGLTSTCAQQAGVTIPRSSKDQINTRGAINVPITAMQPGDLIFFGTGKPHHVASYIGQAANGDSQFIEAQKTGTRLMISLNLQRRRDVLGVRRIFH
jgi:cell wall-associated NlpC family hydrolase